MEYLSEKEFLIAFGKNLRSLRKSKGFTQEDLANEIGIEISQISRIERGVINTSISNAQDIAKAFSIPLSQLFTGL